MLKTSSVPKTIKLFINGQFPRTESGRSLLLTDDNGELYANICQASRKDLRNAVVAGKKAQISWSEKTAYNRGQILYRMAELLASRRLEFEQIEQSLFSKNSEDAKKQIDQAIDVLLYYAGFADKFVQILASINPVSGPFHNFSAPDPMGVVAIITDRDFNLASALDRLASAIISGNTIVAFLQNKGAAYLAPLGEICATSDIPPGVVNLISGISEELLPHFASHMEIQAISLSHKEGQQSKDIQIAAADNMKRVVFQGDEKKCLQNISQLVEIKTVWHPIGL